VGRLVGDKGINELIQAFKQICATKSNFKLLLVGPFEAELDALAQEIEEIESNKKHYFCWFSEDVRPYLSISNCLTFPSYREGFRMW
jgi:glycosyltransferase involved in cell wall biosynthesis